MPGTLAMDRGTQRSSGNGTGPETLVNEKIAAIELEMAYTTWEYSCRDPHISWNGDLKECRRAKNHEGVHAVGFTANGTFYVWHTETVGGEIHGR